METKTLFKVGQKVFDSAMFGDLEGVVNDCDFILDFPIKVNFDGVEVYYTSDGRLDDHLLPTLSDQPYKVEYVPPQPKIEIPEVGQMCYFWDENPNDGFIYAQFVGYDSKKDKYRFSTKNMSNWKHCSTKNPIENEKPN